MNVPTLTRRILFAILSALVAGASVQAQPTKLPTADEVKAIQKKYQDERDAIVKDGIAKRFIPAIMDKADELAKKSETALAAGRLLQASEAIKQARWQLPYQPIGVPDNVSRIIGNLRLRHNGEIHAVVFSPDGTRLASASSDETVKIWDLANGREVLTYTGHSSGSAGSQRKKVRCLAWSADGKTIASAGMEKSIRVWNADDGKDIKVIDGAGEFVSAIALSKDGKHVFTGQYNLPGMPPNGFFVYETQTGKLVREVRDYKASIRALAVNQEGNIVATGDDDGNIRLWQFPSFIENLNQPAYWAQQDPTGATYHLSFSPDSKSLARSGPLGVKIYATPMPGGPGGASTPRTTLNTNGPKCSVFSKDGKTLYVGNFDGSIQFWDHEANQKLGEYKNAHNSPVNAVVFNHQGNQLASCSGDFTIRLLDFDIVLQSRDFEGHEGAVWTAVFSPDGTKILTSSADRTVKVWERDTGKASVTITDHTAPVTVAQFSPDGKLIASGGGDKVIRIFDASNGKARGTGEGHAGTITFLDFSHDSKWIVSGSADRKIKIWDAETGKQKLSIDDNPSIVTSVAFHPNGKKIAVGNIDQAIRLYSAETGKLEQSWNAHGSAVNGVAFSPNGEWLASAGADMAVNVWPMSTPGQNSMRLVGHTGPVSMVAFRKDNQHLVSCGGDQLVKLWKIEGNAAKEMQTFRGHKDWVASVSFSKDGFHVVSASVDRRMKIWEITAKEIPILAEHTSAVETVAVSPDGNLIATGSVDRTIKLWDRKTGVEVATLTGHKQAVMSLAFTPDSKRLISSGSEAAILLWEVNPPREIQRTQQQMNVFGAGKMRRYSPYIALDPKGKTVFVWFPVNEAKVSTVVEAFDIDAGTVNFTLMEENRKVNSLSFCANGKLAATGAKDGTVRLWNLHADKAEVVPGGDWKLFEKAGVADLALTPDATRLIATSDQGEIKIGKLDGRETIKSFEAHKGGIAACMVSPNGNFFATVGTDNVIKVWDMEGKELRSWDLGKHPGMFVVNLAFSHDSRQLITANANTTVYVLDLP